ncbi:MAG: hypothetical protein II003_03315 [Methanobrevibacter sp.]|nr:hypothetical protein [Methanobrevibacter sp.]
MRECHVYIESSITWPKKGSGIVGIIFTDSDDTFSKTLFGRVNNSTEHQAVLYGIVNALKYCDNFDVINIHLSCSYVANAFKWIDSWKQASWKNAKGNIVKNSNIWAEIDKKLQNKELKIHLNEFNGYRKWLKNECDNRGRKHGFIL